MAALPRRMTLRMTDATKERLATLKQATGLSENRIIGLLLNQADAASVVAALSHRNGVMTTSQRHQSDTEVVLPAETIAAIDRYTEKKAPTPWVNKASKEYATRGLGKKGKSE